MASETFYIFSDGNCKSNGQKGARAGYSAFFTEDKDSPLHPFNKTSLILEEPTNNKAELSAIRYILDILLKNPQIFHEKKIVICTDSMYSIQCITTWCHNWMKNGWKTSSKQPVKNKELIQDIVHKKNILSHTHHISFQHIRSHQPEPLHRDTLEWKLWHGNHKVDAEINQLLLLAA